MRTSSYGCERMDFEKFIKSEERTLPVFLLIDVSGSMEGPKIETVNVALKEMFTNFRNIENPKGIIEVCIITFSDTGARVVRELSRLEEGDSYRLNAHGSTPMGSAFDMVHTMLEDTNTVSSRSYTPTVVLISDGNPTDYDVYNKSEAEIKAWPSLDRLINDKRSSKAIRLAMGIGDDMNLDLLRAFVSDPKIPVVFAKDTSTISKFFQWVTTSVSIRSVSSSPNSVSTAAPQAFFDDDEVEF